MITRYNYEEFFLLYIDNELSATERKAVEEFVHQNADLEKELRMLQQSVIKPEKNIGFEDKSLLLKHTEERSIINPANYEEYFLLYLDNELNPATKKEVEKFIHENPSLQNKLSLLQQARLEPDVAIVFEGKEVLFKKEERRKPILFAWMSAAAVAILLVTGFLFFIKKDNVKKTSAQSVADNYNNEKNKVKENKKESSLVTSIIPDSLNNPEDKKKNIAVKEAKFEKQRSKSIAREQRKTKQEDGKKQDDLTAINQDNINKANDVAVVENIKPANQNKNTSTSASNINIAPDKLIVIVAKPDDDGIEKDNKASYVSFAPTIDKGPDMANDDPEKKNKLRGIFRKVSRVFEKTTNVDDDNKHAVAIGSFQIALK